MQKKYGIHTGFLLVEVVIAAAAVIMIAAVFVRLVVGSFELERRARESTFASNFAQEGLEAARSIANRNFFEVVPGTYGLDATSGRYEFTGTPNTYPADTPAPGTTVYTRVITIEKVYRLNGEIVESGGTEDVDTLSGTSIVTWNPRQGGTSTVSLTTYFGNWKSPAWKSDSKSTFEKYFRNSTQVTSEGSVELLIANPIDTLTPFLTHNLTGNADVSEMHVDRIRDRLYIALGDNGVSREFLSYDISDLSRGHISQSGSVELGARSRGFAVGRNYAYVLTDENSEEIRVVDLRTFAVVNVWNMSGNANPEDVILDETANRLYVGRLRSGGDDEFYVLDTTNPLGSLVLIDSAEINADVLGIAIREDFAYLATEDNNGELFIVNVTNMAGQNCDLPGTEDAVAIQIYNNQLFIGRAGGGQDEFAKYAIDPNDPASCPSAVPGKSTDFGSDDMLAMFIVPSEMFAVFPMSGGIDDVRLVRLSNFSEAGQQELDGDMCDAITFFGAYIFAGCRDDTSTLQILEGTSIRAREGRITSTPFDGGVEPTLWQKIWWTMSGQGTIYFRIRTADSLANLKQAEWVGSDGTNATVFEYGDGTTIVPDPSATGTRYIQWQATLSGYGTTPVLENVSITYP